MCKGKRTLLSNAFCQFLYLCVNGYSLKSKYKLIELENLQNCIFTKDKVNMNYMYKHWHRYIRIWNWKVVFFSFDFYYLAIGKLGAKKHTSNIPRYLSYIFNRDDERVHSILYHLITPGRRLRSKIIWFDNHDKKRGVPRGWHELQNCYLCQQPPIFYDNRPLWWDLFQSVKRRNYDPFNNYA